MTGSVAVHPDHSIPVGPLLARLEAKVARLRAGGMSEQEAARYCGTSDRKLREWRSGEHVWLSFNVADRILGELNLNVWDVWDDEAVVDRWIGPPVEELVA